MNKRTFLNTTLLTSASLLMPTVVKSAEPQKREINIDLLKSMIKKTGISVESDMTNSISIFSDGLPCEATSYLITDYCNPEQEIVNYLVACRVTKFKFYVNLQSRTCSFDKSVPNGRSIEHVWGRRMDPCSFAPISDGWQTVVTRDVMRFGYDGYDIRVFQKFTEEELREFIEEKNTNFRRQDGAIRYHKLSSDTELQKIKNNDNVGKLVWPIKKDNYIATESVLVQLI